MSEDIKQLFTEHRADAERPLRIDSETVAKGGRKRRRHRTTGLVAGAVVLVAALTAGAVTLPGYFGGSADAAGKGNEETSDQPSHPLPDLEPLPEGERYAWRTAGFEGEQSDTADEYGDAFVKWFEEAGYPELKFWEGMQVFEEEIVVISDKKKDIIESTGSALPRYRFTGATVNGDGAAVPVIGHRIGDEFENLLMSVYPRDSFLRGSGSTFEYLQNCDDEQRGDTSLDRTCNDATGPNGEPILQAVTEVRLDGKDRVWDKHMTVTVFREDGTAVQVGTTVHDADGAVAKHPEAESFLDFDDLTDLALAMPDAIVTD